MNTYEWLQTILFFVVLLALVKPLGSFMAKVFQGERTFLSPVLAPCEKLIYRISGVKPEDEMGWKRYAGSMLLFNLALFVSLFVMLMTQHLLPLNPQKVPAFTLATGAQHGGQLHDQHQLAGLCRRAGGQLLHPDGGTGGAQLRLRRHRHSDSHRRDPRLRAAQDLHAGQLLGRYDPLHPLHPAADLHHRSRLSWFPRG